MEQKEILELYKTHDPRAVEESLLRYGSPCRQLAMNILAGSQEADKALTITLTQAQENIPSSPPSDLGCYLLRLTRTVALQRYLASHDVKRGKHLFVSILDELSECCPTSNSTTLEGGFDLQAEQARAGECLSRFLKKQGSEGRELFLCRYFYADSSGELARRFRRSESRLQARLHKLRLRLRSFLEHEAGQGWVPNAVTLAQGLNYVEDSLLLTARNGSRRIARWLLPRAATVCVLLALAISFPYLRSIINTDLVLRDRDWRKSKDELEDPEISQGPSEDKLLPLGASGTVADSTLTLTAVTETSASLTLVKTGDLPLYAAVYDRMWDALACTDPDYDLDGVTLRPGRIKVYTEGVAEFDTVLPCRPGTYRLVVDFTSVRKGTYPMEDCLGILSYSDKDTPPQVIYFSLTPSEPSSEGT